MPYPKYRQWAHAPAHLFSPNTAYIVTAATYHKVLLFDRAEKRDFLLQTLFAEAERWEWRLQAWAVMANHYHFVAQAPAEAETLVRLITALHSKTAIWLNKRDETPGRKVWFQYWDTCLTYQRSYLARLNYVHNNPVKHHLVTDAADHPWCSMAWFAGHARTGLRETVFSFRHDRGNVRDDF